MSLPPLQHCKQYTLELCKKAGYFLIYFCIIYPSPQPKGSPLKKFTVILSVQLQHLKRPIKRLMIGTFVGSMMGSWLCFFSHADAFFYSDPSFTWPDQNIQFNGSGPLHVKDISFWHQRDAFYKHSIKLKPSHNFNVIVI